MESLQLLITQAQNGDIDAFETIVTKFQDMAVGYAYSILGDFHLAEDAAQEAFIGAFRNLKMLREPSAFLAWFRRVVFTQCNRLTRGRTLKTESLEIAADVVVDGVDAPTMLIQRERQGHILSALDALPENERVATTLFYMNGYSQKEVADFLEVPSSTINGRLQTARRRLKVAITDASGERISQMVRENLKENLPSKDDQFVNKVQLFNAIEAGRVEKAKALLLATPALVDATTESGQTPLHLAASHGQKEIMQLLLENGAGVDARDADNRTPLHFMVRECTRNDVAQILLDAGADINATDNIGATPAALAADFYTHAMDNVHHTYLVKWFLSKGANADIFTAIVARDEQIASSMIHDDPALIHARQKGGYRFAGATPLHYAARCSNISIVRNLIDAGVDINILDGDGCPPLYLAARFLMPPWLGREYDMVDLLSRHGGRSDIFSYAIVGRIEDVKQQLGNDPTLVRAKDAGGRTPLHLAAWTSHPDVVALLLSKGSDPNLQDKRGNTPLDLANRQVSEVFGKSKAAEVVIETLIRHGAVCDIWTAATRGIVEGLDACLQKDPTLIDKPNDKGFTPLQLAAKVDAYGDGLHEWQKTDLKQEAVDFLLDKDVELDIFSAAQLGRRERIVEMIDTDPKLVNRRSPNDTTLLHIAAANGDVELVRSLLERGAGIDAKEGQWWVGGTPLCNAAIFGHLPVVELFLENGADIEGRAYWERTPLICAEWGNHLDVVKSLVKHGANLYATTLGKTTALHEGAQFGRTEIVEYLLEQGMDVNDMDDGRRETPLHIAAEHGRNDVVEVLLAHGADVNVQKMGRVDGNTPLHKSAFRGQKEAAKRLLAHGADVCAKNDDDMTPLHCAAHKGMPEMIELLLAHGAPINLPDAVGATPLHHAITDLECVEAVEVLLGHGADVGAKDGEVRTPLHYAAWFGQTKIAEVLIGFRAECNAPDIYGKTPLRIGIERGFERTANLLRQHGATE